MLCQHPRYAPSVSHTLFLPDQLNRLAAELEGSAEVVRSGADALCAVAGQICGALRCACSLGDLHQGNQQHGTLPLGASAQLQQQDAAWHSNMLQHQQWNVLRESTCQPPYPIDWFRQRLEQLEQRLECLRAGIAEPGSSCCSPVDGVLQQQQLEQQQDQFMHQRQQAEFPSDASQQQLRSSVPCDPMPPPPYPVSRILMRLKRLEQQLDHMHQAIAAARPSGLTDLKDEEGIVEHF